MQVAALDRLSPRAEDHQAKAPGGWRADARSWLLRHALFLIIVVAPTLIAALYYGVFLSDRYVSEARFVVRRAESGAATALSNVLKLSGLGTPSIEDTYIVGTYLQSPDVVAELVAKDHYLDVLSRPEADAVSRYPNFWLRPSLDRLTDRFRNYVHVELDRTSQVDVLAVEAFRPADAQAVARALIQHAETFLNQLNDRANANAIANAQSAADIMQKRMQASLDELTTFREAHKVIDPSAEFKSGIEIITRLEIELSQVNSQISDMDRQTGLAPSLPKMHARANSLKEQIELERTKLAGGDASLAPMFAEYERLYLQREFASKSLAAALVELDVARQEANRKKLYLELVATPSLPDRATMPRRLIYIGLVALLGVVAHQILIRLLANVLEHAAWSRPKRKPAEQPGH